MSNSVPGAGFYNPHDEVDKLKSSKGDWKTWTAKHSQWNNILTKR